jgi:hypothetical protein
VSSTLSLTRAIERRLKVRLHVQLAADPRTHGWTLSLYRAGEIGRAHV